MKKVSKSVVRTADVIGKKIVGVDGENLGKVEEIVIDKFTGEVRYAVLAHGGFMGLGSDFYGIPWAMLKYCVDSDGFEVNFGEEDIKKAPGFNKDHWPDFADEAWIRSADDFYNHLINTKSPMVKEQRDFISEGGNSQPLGKKIF